MKNFKETRLPKSFAQKPHKMVKELLLQGQSFSVIAMPASGVAPFLEFVASQNYAYFIFLDIHELAEFTKDEFLKELYLKISSSRKNNPSFTDCKEALIPLLKRHKQVVIIINKFSLLSSEFTHAFFGNFRTLTHGLEGKLSVIFSTIKPYLEYNEDAITGSNMHIFSRYIYFGLYEKKDLLQLLTLHSPELLKKKNISHALDVCGGHIQLLQLILRSEFPNRLLEDVYIKLLLKQIFEIFTFNRQRQLRKIAENKYIEDIDPFLLRMCVVKKSKNGYELFSPLFQQYLQEKKLHHLPPKETILFQLLKKNQGKIISVQKIFETVWKENPQEASNWALDSLIYRLRRHRAVTEKGFIIKSHKKLGYQLLKEL